MSSPPNFNNNGRITGDKYYTPKYVWEHINHLIPKDKVIWEPFNDGSQNSLLSSKNLIDLGNKVIVKSYNEETKENDFFTSNYGDIVVSNPPFSIKKQIMFRLYDLDKPFILVMPTSTINNLYMKKFVKNIQIIVPPKRINFDRIPPIKSNASFDCFYVCWKMNLPKDLIFIE